MSDISGIHEGLCRMIGETVTIFTTSGGQSGFGFTGVVLCINPCFVRLITRIGPAPGCALGNACSGYNPGTVGGAYGRPNGCRCGYNLPIVNIGSVVDIPLDKIAAFVHNAV